MTTGKSKTLTKRLSLSITDDERARFDRLCELEGRKGRQQVMHMVDQRLAELGHAKDG